MEMSTTAHKFPVNPGVRYAPHISCSDRGRGSIRERENRRYSYRRGRLSTINVKGTVSRDGYFFDGLNILTVSYVYALMVSRPFKSFSLPYLIDNFLFASLKLLTILKKMLTETIFRILFSVIG